MEEFECGHFNLEKEMEITSAWILGGGLFTFVSLVFALYSIWRADANRSSEQFTILGKLSEQFSEIRSEILEMKLDIREVVKLSNSQEARISVLESRVHDNVVEIKGLRERAHDMANQLQKLRTRREVDGD